MGLVLNISIMVAPLSVFRLVMIAELSTYGLVMMKNTLEPVRDGPEKMQLDTIYQIMS